MLFFHSSASNVTHCFVLIYITHAFSCSFIYKQRMSYFIGLSKRLSDYGMPTFFFFRDILCKSCLKQMQFSTIMFSTKAPIKNQKLFFCIYFAKLQLLSMYKFYRARTKKKFTLTNPALMQYITYLQHNSKQRL